MRHRIAPESPILIKAILFLGLLIFMLSTTSATLGTFKSTECVPIITALNESAVNITSISSPSPSPQVLASNIAMTKTGNQFNYTFCNVTRLGRYTYGYCGNSGNCYSNDFIISGSGQEVSDSQIMLVIIGIVVMLIVTGFFFTLSILFKHPGTKIFLMSLSALTLIVVIGLIAGNAYIYLAEFPGLVTIYNTYYIAIITLSGACMTGLVLWLIYYSVTLFKKTRGRIPED